MSSPHASPQPPGRRVPGHGGTASRAASTAPRHLRSGPPAHPAPRPEAVHPGLGRLGLLLVSVACVLGTLVAGLLGHLVGTMMQRAGTPQVTTAQLRSMFPARYHQVVWLSIAWLAVATTGMVGWVICFVALSRGSGRRLAGTGIVLGVLGLLASGVAMLAGMLPHLPR